ncbi:ABC transporter substrate-binding protein [Pseudobutyrivibrio xylanivorans]|uniref:ABC transporter substrate-binding protein n=1 Tax=Pseudobutyrivibrio xylanivorans TaxID=185007 RepID=A0A5P6VV40_PSEXY|nr:extracellular solute-binding protein [Pseudobutyrivibrio xylanivorans]QFJ55174.1 ABC transporter substrate-binding protein [Pseudobutyrivibrio xylanivorans]
MKNLSRWMLCLVITGGMLFTGCSSQVAEVTEEEEAAGGTITLLNIKSEINEQMETLAKAYQAETGVEVKIMNVPAGVDAQATLKGYYLSDQMPDIIACEASGFSNWEGLLVDMSDQDWAKRTEAAYVDSTYGTIGFPYTTEAIGLAYNADILEKCGVDPASITGPSAMRSAFEAVAAKKDELGLKAVVGYSAEPVNLGWSAGNHLTGVYIDSGLARDDTTYIDMIANDKKVDDTRFADFAQMIGLFNQYSDPELLTAGIYDDQVADFAAGKYAFITQGSWIGASLTSSDAYAAAGSFKVGMVPYAFEDGMDTILTAAPSWWGVFKEGNVEAAVAFLEWCSEDAGQKILVESAGCVSPFTDCKYVASDPFAQTISDYIAAGKTSNWHWMQLPEGIGNSEGGFCYSYYRYASGELDANGFKDEFNRTIEEWYAKL